MEKHTGLEYIETVLLYLLSGVKEIELDKIEKMLETEKSGRVKEMITSLAERLEQKGYNRALELVKRAEERAEAEKQRAEAEKQRAEAEKQRAEAEKQRATHKARLKTAVSMRKKGLDLLLIADISEIQQEYLEKLFRKIGI